MKKQIIYPEDICSKCKTKKQIIGWRTDERLPICIPCYDILEQKDRYLNASMEFVSWTK